MEQSMYRICVAESANRKHRDNDEPQNPLIVYKKSLKPASAFTKRNSPGQIRGKANRLAALREVLCGYELPRGDDFPALPVDSQP